MAPRKPSKFLATPRWTLAKQLGAIPPSAPRRESMSPSTTPRKPVRKSPTSSSTCDASLNGVTPCAVLRTGFDPRSEEHTSELQSHSDLVCRLLLEKKHQQSVAGTHGKRTTTSMISVALTRAGLHPTFVLGADLNESCSVGQHLAGRVFVAQNDQRD